MTTKPLFATETDLCAAFIAAIPVTWTAYPETAGWDILLVRRADGFQIGIEAKLKLNAIVLTQALEGWGYEYHDSGPDCRAVLVPSGAGGGMDAIAGHLALTVVRIHSGRFYGSAFSPSLPEEGKHFSSFENGWHELCPLKRCPLPEYVPDVEAGASGPSKLTTWKIAAIKIAVLLERRGYVSRLDFRALKIDPRRWLDGQWLRKGDAGLVRGDHLPDFKRQHPRNFDEIAADFDLWSKKLPAAAKQEAML